MCLFCQITQDFLIGHFNLPIQTTVVYKVRVLERAVRAVQLAPPMTSLFLMFSNSRSYI